MPRSSRCSSRSQGRATSPDDTGNRPRGVSSSGVPAPQPRPWKVMLVAAGVAAIAGLFLPLIVIHRGPIRVGQTAMELSFHLDKTRALLDKEFSIPPIADRRIPTDWKDAR